MLQAPQASQSQTAETEQTTTSATEASAAKAEAAKEAYKEDYRCYARSQQAFQAPVVRISVETAYENRTEVHMETQYRSHTYHFRSIQTSDEKPVYEHLNSQPLVRAKYANTKTVDRSTTQARVNLLSERFNPQKKEEGCYMYGGFIVSDAEAEAGEEAFLGMVNIGVSGTEGVAEIALLNRSDAWSHPVKSSVVEEYKRPEEGRLKKSYQGLGTAETCVLVQYANYLQTKKHALNGHPLKGICATARVDNPGSWKSIAKLGFELTDVDSNPSYGPELRYQLRKILK